MAGGAATVASAVPVVTIAIPGTPRGKGRARFVRATGRAYTPAQTESYEAVIRQTAAGAMCGAAPMAGPVRLTMRVVVPIPPSWTKKAKAAALTGEKRPTGKPDYDNFAKLLGDACNGIVYRDDSQIWRATVEKVYGERPCVVATFEETAER